jgi:UDPglucose 6-dehydrogenase
MYNKNMIIGIVGLGVIGSAAKYGFEKLGHTVKVHDLKFDTELSSLLDSEIIYVCVPTPSNEDGSCNTSIVELVVDELHKLNYKNVIAIKSTVEPGLTRKLIDSYKNDNICFVPEFLRERCAISDFIENHDLLAIGTENKSVFETIKKSHGGYPRNIKQLSPTEAELLKYYSNIYNAMRIIFANEMYEVAKRLDANYSRIKEAYCLRNTKDMYLDVNENFRGYGGVCLPKDTKAIAALCKRLDLDLKLFETIDSENNKFKMTVFDNMREY